MRIDAVLTGPSLRAQLVDDAPWCEDDVRAASGHRPVLAEISPASKDRGGRGSLTPTFPTIGVFGQAGAVQFPVTF